MKMKKFLILFLITLLIGLIIVLFVFLKDIMERVIISIPLFILLACFIYLLVIDCFVGKKEYIYQDNILIIKRRNQVLNTIRQTDVKKMIVYYDCINESEIYRISFKCKKRYIIYVNENNKETINNFISGMKYEKKKNYLYHFLSIFIH